MTEDTNGSFWQRSAAPLSRVRTIRSHRSSIGCDQLFGSRRDRHQFNRDYSGIHPRLCRRLRPYFFLDRVGVLYIFLNRIPVKGLGLRRIAWPSQCRDTGSGPTKQSRQASSPYAQTHVDHRPGRFFTVHSSGSDAGTGLTIPKNSPIIPCL